MGLSLDVILWKRVGKPENQGLTPDELAKQMVLEDIEKFLTSTTANYAELKRKHQAVWGEMDNAQPYLDAYWALRKKYTVSVNRLTSRLEKLKAQITLGDLKSKR